MRALHGCWLCVVVLAAVSGCGTRPSPADRVRIEKAIATPFVGPSLVGEAMREGVEGLKNLRFVEPRPDLPDHRPADRTDEAPRLTAHAGDKPIEFALAHTSVFARVTGNVARVEMVQRYQNPTAERLEAIYAFPLPENAAVTDMVFRIGDRLIRSEVHRRAEARRTYEEARAEGKAAALTEQERPNLFTQSVANIPPGASVEVLLEYVQEIPFDDGRYQLVVPTTIGPRYIPGDPIPSDGPGRSPDTTRVADASRVTPPVVPEGAHSAHDIDIAVQLAPGDAFADIASKSHRITVADGKGATVIGLAPDDRVPNRDFILSYRPSAPEPEARVLVEQQGGESYVMLFVQPPAHVAPEWVRPREMVFLIDRSGSMMGKPLDTARALVTQALRRLGPDDTFQLIAFDGSADAMSPAPLPNNAANVALGEAWLKRLTGGGGTEMLSGIRAALVPSSDEKRLRMVIFCTDGFIGNEAEIIEAVDRQRGQARVFGFGIGTSVNRYLIEGVARAGRGAAEIVLPDESVDGAVTQLYRRLDSPMLTDLTLSWNGLEVIDQMPARLPDLFAGQPLVVVGRLKANATGSAVLRGRLGDAAREMRIPVDGVAAAASATPAAESALGTLWARRRIDDLANRQPTAPAPSEVEEITRLGLQYKLLTQYTSFVAVEHRVSVDPSTPLRQMLVPNELAKDVSREGALGGQVSITPLRVKPGDPEIHIQTGPGARTVRVALPFGEADIDAVADPRGGGFVARFLVPPGWPDGSYEARITIGYDSGATEVRTAPIRVDTTAAVVAVVQSPRSVHAGDVIELGLKPAVSLGRLAATLGDDAPGGRLDALKSAMDVKEILVRAPWGELVTAEIEGTLGVYMARLHVPPEYQPSQLELEIVASDTAGNVSRRGLALRVVTAGTWIWSTTEITIAAAVVVALLGALLGLRRRRRVAPRISLAVARSAL